MDLPDPSRLHQQVDLVVPPAYRLLYHLLVDLGRIERLECTMERCLGETREFSPYVKGAAVGRGGVYDPWQCTINHIDQKSNGGKDRIDNVELGHARCNFSDGGKAADAKNRKLGWFSDEARERQRSAAAEAMRRQEVRDKKSASMRARHADPEYKKLARQRAKKAWETRRKKTG